MDRYEIKAEIERQGATLTDVAKAAGLHGATVRGALRYPIPAGNRAISRFLGKPLHELWPAWFDQDGRLHPGVSSLRLRRSASSRKRRAS